MDIKTLCLDLDSGVLVENGYKFPFNVYNSIMTSTLFTISNIPAGNGYFRCAAFNCYVRASGTVDCSHYSGSNTLRYYISPLTPSMLFTVDPD